MLRTTVPVYATLAIYLKEDGSPELHRSLVYGNNNADGNFVRLPMGLHHLPEIGGVVVGMYPRVSVVYSTDMGDGPIVMASRKTEFRGILLFLPEQVTARAPAGHECRRFDIPLGIWEISLPFEGTIEIPGGRSLTLIVEVGGLVTLQYCDEILGSVDLNHATPVPVRVREQEAVTA